MQQAPQEYILNQRSRQILKTVVNIYLDTAEPVGSRVVSRRGGVGVSPATVRNVMADLEEMGLLFQPHTSAGRVPTEEGLRFYVSELLEKEDLSWGDQVALEKGLLESRADLEETLKQAVFLLAGLTGQAALATHPKPAGTDMTSIKFVKIGPGVVMVVFVFDNGLVQNRVVNMGTDQSEAFLERLSGYLNERLRQEGFDELRQSLVREVEEKEKDLNGIFNEISGAWASGLDPSDVIVGGRANLLEQPEFANVSRLKAVLKAFEEKKILVDLLDRSMEAQGVQILIGSQGLGSTMPGCSMILAPYIGSDHPVGGVGVVGPMRMNYARATALVEYVAQILGEKIKER